MYECVFVAYRVIMLRWVAPDFALPASSARHPFCHARAPAPDTRGTVQEESLLAPVVLARAVNRGPAGRPKVHRLRFMRSGAPSDDCAQRQRPRACVSPFGCRSRFAAARNLLAHSPQANFKQRIGPMMRTFS